MCDYRSLARYIKLFFIKILPLTCSVIKTLRIITGFQFRALGFQLRALGALDSCLQKSIVVNENERGARSIKLFSVKIFLEKLGNVKVCLQKSINVNKNQRGARYVQKC